MKNIQNQSKKIWLYFREREDRSKYNLFDMDLFKLKYG